MVGMSKEDRFWFGKVRFRVLEGKMGVREAYDCMAGVYDFSEYLYWTRKMEEAEERVIGKWVDGFSGVCLDVGCGTGRYALRIAKKGVEVVALDFSLKMLKRLKAKKSGFWDRLMLWLRMVSVCPLERVFLIVWFVLWLLIILRIVKGRLESFLEY